MYVCMYVRMYVCMHACMHAYIAVGIPDRGYPCSHLWPLEETRRTRSLRDPMSCAQLFSGVFAATPLSAQALRLLSETFLKEV